MRFRSVAFAAAVVCAFTAGPLRGASAEEATPPTLRLPDGARPTRYAVTLTIVPGKEKAPGEIVIDAELDRPHALLWLNAAGITIARAAADDPGTRATVVPGNDQFVGLAFDPPLAAGAHRLTLAFEAEQHQNSSRGIFTLKDGGAWYAMTQFEPMAARQAFPCFDEPAFKVPWQLTLNVPRGLTAVSNAVVASEADAGDGMKTVRFEPTEPLPSYLVAFAVGPWEVSDLGRFGARPTPLRVIAPKGRSADLAFAARVLPELFVREERWFGSHYPFAKLDQIAIPLTVRFAMENAALITYAAPLLLQPGVATPPFRHALANVGAHEIAHQWFGNLVTPAWWDDIWLNEAFATWFAEKIVDAWDPAYERGAQRVHARAEAIEDDALLSARRIREPIRVRGDIFNAFDSITYEKGATVIGMFEGWIGEAAFRHGVQKYLAGHRYASATVGDFLDALTQDSGRPVGPAFTSFLEQNGVPQVDVRLECADRRARLELAQRRHVAADTPPAPGLWQIPVCVRYGNAASQKRACTLLSSPRDSLDLPGGCPAFVFANAGGVGYYIPDYRGDLLSRLRMRYGLLTPAEFASLLYDMRPLVRAGSIDGAAALEWIRAGARSRDRHVTTAAIDLASFVRDQLVADADRARFT
jgi:alanyl aminopeptidase